MDDATRSRYRAQIGQHQRRINQLQDDKAALMQRISKLEEGKLEFNRMRNYLLDDCNQARNSMPQIPTITSLRSAQRLSVRLLDYNNDAWERENLAGIDDAVKAADDEIDEAEYRIRLIDSEVNQLYSSISQLQHQISRA
jgi:chromosome segregation ATPase